MGIYYQSYVIGDVRAQQVTASPGIGGIQLTFILEWTIHPKQDQDYGIFGTFIRVDAAVEGTTNFQHLGHAFPEVAFTAQAHEGIPYPRALVYKLTLPLEQLLALEAKRQNQGLAFRLEVRGNSHGKLGIQSIDQTLHLNVQLSDWLRILATAGVGDTLLIGLPLPLDAETPSLATPLALVRNAHRHLQHGLYDACVSECRKALDSLWAITSVKDAAVKARTAFATRENREAQNKHERTLVIGEALRSFTHQAHHVDDDGVPEIYSRLDATLTLATTSALIGTLSATPFEKDEEFNGEAR